MAVKLRGLINLINLINLYGEVKGFVPKDYTTVLKQDTVSFDVTLTSLCSRKIDVDVKTIT